MGVMELPERVEVVNIGLERFETAVRDQGAPAVGVDWRIPAGGDAEAVAALARLMGPASDRIDTANAEVIGRLDRGAPMLRGIETAGAVIGGFDSGTILHCGPPIGWTDMCDPLRRSVRAAVVAEGWAPHRDAAEVMLQAGEIRLEAANEYCTVVPMATAIGPTAPVYVVSVDSGGTTAYSSLNQGSGAAAWFGVDSEAAIDRLSFLRDALAPALAQALDRAGPIDVFSLAAQGVAMGDDVHMRVQATTNLLLRRDLGRAPASSPDGPQWHHLRRPPRSEWFIAPSPPVQDALYYPGQGDRRGGAGRAGRGRRFPGGFLSTNHLMFLNVAMASTALRPRPHRVGRAGARQCPASSPRWPAMAPPTASGLLAGISVTVSTPTT